MFSSLSKLADKSFILGFFLPALIGISGVVFANRDVKPFKFWFEASVAATAKIDDLAVALVVVWLFAVLLLAFNHLAFRLLEGYVWPWRTALAKWPELKRRQRQISRRDKYETRWHNATSELEKAREAGTQEKLLLSLERKEERWESAYYRAAELNRNAFPDRGLVLATRFGNAIRSFEAYSTSMYEVDSIYVWSRLLAVVPKDYQTLMADARALVDFFVGLVVTLYVIATVAVFRAIYSWAFCPNDPLLGRHIWTVVVALVVGSLCYRGAVSAAIKWGETVKGAFDVYLPKLAQALGFALPDSPDLQRKFWSEWSTQFRFQTAADLADFTRLKVEGSEEKSRGAGDTPPKEDDENC